MNKEWKNIQRSSKSTSNVASQPSLDFSSNDITFSDDNLSLAELFYSGSNENIGLSLDVESKCSEQTSLACPPQEVTKPLDGDIKASLCAETSTIVKITLYQQHLCQVNVKTY